MNEQEIKNLARKIYEEIGKYKIHTAMAKCEIEQLKKILKNTTTKRNSRTMRQDILKALRKKSYDASARTDDWRRDIINLEVACGVVRYYFDKMVRRQKSEQV